MATWTEERVEMLQRRFRAGDSFAQIARAVGGGISRSACIGKAARLGLERGRRLDGAAANSARISQAKGLRAPPVARATAQNNGLNFTGPRPRRAGLKALAAFEAPGPEATGPEAVRIVEVERRHCRWPLGDPEGPDFRFCGATRTRGAYCARHAARAYVATPEGQGVEWLERLFARLT